jgi:hypothetical protein
MRESNRIQANKKFFFLNTEIKTLLKLYLNVS